ncbi:MAG: hypothetical protein WCD31_11200, partial [Gillisia sp.]
MILESVKKLYHQFRINKSLFLDSLFGDKDYRKFVIICDSRTGSTLLLNLLGFHPEIGVEGEKFRAMDHKSGEAIWNEIFRKRKKRIKQVGFKLFYFHAKGEDQKVWELLEQDKSITIVHLTRQNLLRSLVSKKIGLKTKKWTENINSKEEIGIQEKRISLGKEECENYFETI